MQVVFLFYDGMTALDAIGPHSILDLLKKLILKIRDALLARMSAQFENIK